MCARRHLGAVRASNNTRWARKTLEAIKTAEGRGSDYEVSLWDLFELDHTNGGHGRKSNLGKTLDRLDPTTLGRVREWIDDNTGEAIERYGSHSRFVVVRASVGILAHYKALPPEPIFGEIEDESPLRMVSIRKDGKKWDLMLPVRAELMRRARRKFTDRRIARILGMPWSSYNDMRSRAESRAFRLGGFTPADLDAIVRRRQGAREHDSQ